MKINVDLLKKLEKTIDTYHPERGQVPIKILGYGEISLVFELLNDPASIAYKRLPVFENKRQVNYYIKIYDKYNKILSERVGLNIPEYKTAWVEDPEGKPVLYCAQKKLPPESIGNKIIHDLNSQNVNKLIILVMRELKKVWKFNIENEDLKLGLDGQISNFSLGGYDPSNPKIPEDGVLQYLDTSTPLYRKNGIEAINPDQLLKSLAFFLRPIVKYMFVQEILDRYYDWRLVTIDLIANFFKEQLPRLIPGIVKVTNKFFADEAKEFNIEPITLKEVQDYYKSDKMIWVVVQNSRKIDRFIKTKLLRRRYLFYLPGKIQR